MLKAKFLQAVKIGKKVFPLGSGPNGHPVPRVHDVSKEEAEHPHFKKYVECGWIVDPDEKAPAQETVHERNLRLAQKLREKTKKSQAPIAKESDEEFFGDDADGDIAEEHDDHDSQNSDEGESEFGGDEDQADDASLDSGDDADEESEPSSEDEEPEEKPKKAQRKKKRKARK